jgi:hypothetical protein
VAPVEKAYHASSGFWTFRGRSLYRQALERRENGNTGVPEREIVQCPGTVFFCCEASSTFEKVKRVG